MFSESQLAEIRSRIPIVELISEYVQLKKSGKNYQGLCPFHQERSPSFFVNPDRESFHCFGCGHGGTLFHFLMKIEGIAFPEAVEKLAERAGVEVQTHSSKNKNPANLERRHRGLELLRQAAWYYHCLLKKNAPEELENYLKQRQISKESCEQFYLGYCPAQDSGLAAYLTKKGFSSAEIERSGLFKGTREFFRQRLLFPIFRADKKVVGFGGRLIDDKGFGPKYLNSAESEFFKKSELLYGFHHAKLEARKKGRFILAEGYLDVISLQASGFSEAVAPLGTALSPWQVRQLAQAEEVLLIFDADSAGERASLRALEAFLAVGVFPKMVTLETGEDPDSYLRNYGKLAFEKKIEKRRNLLEDLLEKWAKSSETELSFEQKGRLAKRGLALIQKIPDGVTQKLYQRQLAELLEIPEEWIQTQEKKKRKIVSVASVATTKWLPEEETLLAAWIQHPELRAELAKQLKEQEFVHTSAQEVLQLFLEIYRQNPSAKEAEYFDRLPSGPLEKLSRMAISEAGHFDLSEIVQTQKRLFEKKLRGELKTFKKSAKVESAEEIQLMQDKIRELSKIVKERNYGAG